VNEDYTSGEAYIPGLDKPVQLTSTTALEFVKGFHNMRPGKDGKVPILPPPPVLPAVENWNGVHADHAWRYREPLDGVRPVDDQGVATSDNSHALSDAGPIRS
jgi:hypothetical protein